MLAFCLIFLYIGFSNESEISLLLANPIHGKLGEVCAHDESSVTDSSRQKVSYVLVDMRDVSAHDMNSGEISSLIQSRVSQSKIDHSRSFQNTDSVALVIPYDSLPYYAHLLKTNNRKFIAVIQNTTDLRSPNNYPQVLTCQDSALKKILLKDSSRISSTGLLAEIYLPRNLTLGENMVSFFLLHLMSIGSIILATIIIIRNHEMFLLRRIELVAKSSTHPWISKVVSLIMVLISTTIILLVFFFYDVMVHFFQIIFVVSGATCMTVVFSTCLQDILPSIKRATISICKRKINVVTSLLFLLNLSFTLTWYFYRNDPNVGWIMQNTIAIFLIIAILTDISYGISLKVIVIIFAIFIAYDVFFVFITPFFFKTSSHSTPVANELLNGTLVRTVRSTESIMEAVATGSAGKSGELIPLVFKIFPGYLFPQAFNVCNTRQYMLLGFGDAVLPGALCAFLAFYDACWRRKIPYNLLASISGYFLGCIITTVVVLVAKSGQPALLYLCPCTLTVTLLSALIIGGRSEIRNLWLANLPTKIPVLSPAVKLIEDEKLCLPVHNVGDQSHFIKTNS